jgi:flagellar assembly protein FliH
MILRQAILSEQSRALEPVRVRVPAAPPPPTIAAEALPPPPPQPSAEIRVREAPLTFESVAAWLAVQDSETRVACASILAEELTHVHETAKADGRALGEAQGREEARRQVRSTIDALERIASKAQTAFDEEERKLADVCTEIVAEAFAKIAGAQLPTRLAAAGAVGEVLKRVKEGRELTVRVSPAELAMLQQEESQLAAAVPGRKFSLVADARVELGGCIVESKLGTLDGRLEVQLRELYATLRAARSSQVELS